MKLLIFISFVLSTSICFGQITPTIEKLDTLSVGLSAYERGQVIEHDSFMQQIQKHNQDYLAFLARYLTANGIDPARVSLHPDSLKFIASKKFLITLRPLSKGSGTITTAGKSQK